MDTNQSETRTAPAWYAQVPGREFTKDPEGSAISGPVSIKDSGFDQIIYRNGDKSITFMDELMVQDGMALGSSVFPMYDWAWDESCGGGEIAPNDRNAIIADIRNAFKLWGPLPAVFEWDAVPTTGVKIPEA